MGFLQDQWDEITMNQKDEQWVSCIENSLYEISSWGNVRTKYLKRRVNLYTSPAGYKTARLHSTGHEGYKRRGRSWLVHRLVATAFLGEIPEKYVVHHIDHSPGNNRVENLKIVSMKENAVLSRWPGWNRSTAFNAPELIKCAKERGWSFPALADDLGIPVCVLDKINLMQVPTYDPTTDIADIISNIIDLLRKYDSGDFLQEEEKRMREKYIVRWSEDVRMALWYDKKRKQARVGGPKSCRNVVVALLKLFTSDKGGIEDIYVIKRPYNDSRTIWVVDEVSQLRWNRGVSRMATEEYTFLQVEQFDRLVW